MKMNVKYAALVILVVMSSCYGMQNNNQDERKDGTSPKSSFDSSKQAEDSAEVSMRKMFIVLPSAEALHAHFQQCRDIPAFQHFARKSNFIARIASKQLSFAVLKSIIKQELRVFVKSIMRNDATLQWEFWGVLAEIDDLDDIAVAVVGYLSKLRPTIIMVEL
jgi:hypothetical protein